MHRSLLRLFSLLCVLLALLTGCSDRGSPNSAETGSNHSIQRLNPGLPPEALETLELIQRGGPFPYRRDGITFQNRERLLPLRERGYYREYTVPTPGSRDRGARRIVTGGDPPEVFYYTSDHYRSFQPITLRP